MSGHAMLGNALNGGCGCNQYQSCGRNHAAEQSPVGGENSLLVLDPVIEPVETVAPAVIDDTWNDRPWKERKREIEDFARAELQEWGMGNIPVKWSRSQSTWGYARTTMERWSGRIVSQDLFLNESCQDLSEEKVKGIVLHELSHFVAGAGAGHGPVFKEACQRVDAGRGLVEDSHEYEMSDEEKERAKARLERERNDLVTNSKYVGRCPQGHEFPSKGKPRRTFLCCKDECRSMRRDDRVLTYEKRHG